MSYFGNKIELKDGPQLDAFSRLRVSISKTLFDSQQEYGLQTSTTWDASANGTFATPSTNGSATSGSNAVGPINANTRMTPITVSTTNGHYSILQSRQYTRYIPGKSHLVFMTGVFASGADSAASFVRRTSTSGSVDDTDNVVQANWNIDLFDGTGPSGITVDFTKTQILFIQAQWLGVGRVVVGFDINGVLYPAHQFLHANILTVPYTQTFNLPVRYQIRTSGTDSISECGYFDAYNGVFLRLTRAHGGSPQTINAVCASVQSEGGESTRGFPRTVNTGISSVGVTTRRPVLSIRASALFNTLTNRCHIEMADYRLVASTNNALFEIVLGGTLTAGGGAPTWNSVATTSAADYNTDADAISGGSVVLSDFVLTGGGVVRGESSGEVDIRNPLVISQIDSTLNRQDAISIVCTSFTGTSNILAAMNWHEQQT